MGSGTLGQNKQVVVVDYGMGNVRSVAKAFELLGAKVVISSQAKEIKQADFIVLPGVGAFAQGMANLKKLGLISGLRQAVLKNKKPFLGICLGMQLLARDSEEFGRHKGLGWIDASVKPLESIDKKIKVPHVGWNNIKFSANCPFFKNIKQDSDLYFVHSYHLVCDLASDVAATCDYGIKFTAAINRDNIFATQFHPEKSPGLRKELFPVYC